MTNMIYEIISEWSVWKKNISDKLNTRERMRRERILSAARLCWP